MSDEIPTDATPQLSDTDSSDDESEDEPAVESLVAGRERRKTAGNRYDRDMVLDEAGDGEEEDEVALLFADNEEEEDEEFKSADDDDDIMSSDDDDDQGPNAAADDMEGEKELEKQAKAERAKKRKADLALTSVSGFRKKVKTDPTQPSVKLPPKPSKKKERVTWLNTTDAAGRTSLRKQTIAHREETIARIKESEAQSKKLKALKEKRDKERAKDAPKELTQEDRLAEAARVEKQNSKSLNRWEATEKKRAEEQAAKLAALKNRKLEGPVISWWSAKATWVGPRLNKIGTKDGGDVLEGGGIKVKEPKKRGRWTNEYHAQLAAAKASDPGASNSGSPTKPGPLEPSNTAVPDPPSNGPSTKDATTDVSPSAAAPQADASTDIAPSMAPSAASVQPNASSTTPQEPADSLLQGIDEFAKNHAGDEVEGSDQVSTIPKDSKTPNIDTLVPENEQSQSETRAGTATPSMPDTTKADPPKVDPPLAVPVLITEVPEGKPDMALSTIASTPPSSTQNIQPAPETLPAQAPRADLALPLPKIEVMDTTPNAPAAEPEPEKIEHSTRNLVILEKFEDLSNASRQEYALFYNKAKAAKLAKHSQELCPITTMPVRYRDPGTGIGFANVVGYTKLQELQEHKFVWSSMLGCYVGRAGGPAARHVPEGFVQK